MWVLLWPAKRAAGKLRSAVRRSPASPPTPPSPPAPRHPSRSFRATIASWNPYFAAQTQKPLPQPHYPASSSTSAAASASAPANIRPFLSLPERLSQTWMNKYTLLFLLLLVKILLFSRTLTAALAATQRHAESTCATAEAALPLISAVPTAVGRAVASMADESAAYAAQGLRAGLRLAATAAENVIVFAIEILLGTQICLITAAADGTVALGINASEAVISFVNDTVIDVLTGVDEGLTALSDLVNDVAEKVEEGVDYFSYSPDSTKIHDQADTEFGKIHLGLGKLRNFSIPASVTDTLDSVRNSTWQYDDVESKLTAGLRKPFRQLQAELSESGSAMAGWNDTFATAVEAASAAADSAAAEAESQNGGIGFCDSLDFDHFYSSANTAAVTVTRILVAVLAVAAVAAIIMSCVIEHRRWRRLQSVESDMAEICSGRPGKRGTTIISRIEAVERPINAFVYRKIVKITGPQIANEAEWLANYCLSPNAAAVLAVGVAGVAVFLLQWAILARVRSVLPNLEAQTTATGGTAANGVAKVLKIRAEVWTEHINAQLAAREQQINTQLFTKAQTATAEINSTAAALSEQINNAVADTVGGTFLEPFFADAVYCTIGRKLEKVQKAMTWIHDKSSVKLPRIDEGFVADAMAGGVSGVNGTSLVTRSDTGSIQSAVTNVAETVAQAVKTVLDQYASVLLFELKVALAFLAVWVLNGICGAVYLWLWRKRLSLWRSKEEFNEKPLKSRKCHNINEKEEEINIVAEPLKPQEAQIDPIWSRRPRDSASPWYREFHESLQFQRAI